jgi:predicted ATPase
MRLINKFKIYCENNNFEINKEQIKVINKLQNFHKENFENYFIKKIFKKNSYNIGFYLVGDVGVGKTMILDYFFDQIKNKKQRFHFNEFMIKFHDFVFQNKNSNKDNIIDNFVKDLKKKTKLLYFDEFQVTNIVDAMILGKLFKKIFEEKIIVIFSSNIKIDDLYKEGLQRDQFIPFLEILKKYCLQQELIINEDYRSIKNPNFERFLAPINQSNNFVFNKYFRKITKNKIKNKKKLEIKGRNLIIENFYEGIAKFKFEDLCNRNLGSEDYIKIANNCDFIFIENLPEFNEYNSNQQKRFITLVDIIYEKKIPLMITSQVDLSLMKSSKILQDTFKRSISRLYELTSIKYNYL